MSDIEPYLRHVTSEHADKSNFIATVSTLVQPVSDVAALIASLVEKFDLDVAIGVQLDVDGQWAGRSRFLTTPLTGVYFALDTVNVGLDEGTWWEPFNPLTALIRLPDDAYRTLLRAIIAQNAWDGSIPMAYTLWDTLFASNGYRIAIQSHGDMSMTVALVGPIADAVTLALFTLGQLAPKPVGVGINYAKSSLPGTPLFGLDADNDTVGGLDHGAWIIDL